MIEFSRIDWDGINNLEQKYIVECTACGKNRWNESREAPVGWVRHLNVLLCSSCVEAIGGQTGKVGRGFLLSYVNKIDEMENNAIEQLKTAASERDKLRMYLEGNDEA